MKSPNKINKMERIEKRAYSAPAVKSFTVSPQGIICLSGEPGNSNSYNDLGEY